MRKISQFSNFLRASGLEPALQSLRPGKESVLFIDYCRVSDKYDFLDELSLSLAPYHLVLLDGANATTDVNFENMTRITPPAEVYYLKDLALPSGTKFNMGGLPPELEPMATLFRAHCEEVNDYVDQNIVRTSINTAYLFTMMTIRLLQPKLVVIWNAFHPLSQTAKYCARLSGVPIAYAEYGVLPGSMNIDFEGQMGESAVAQKTEAFQALPLNDQDLAAARMALDVLAESGANRRPQSAYGESNFAQKVQEAAAGRPIVLFAGHNDLAAGTYPYTKTSAQYHSPTFETSGAAGRALVEICAEHNWYLLYKPHPCFQKGADIEDHLNMTRVGDININECIDVADVVCTVLSQVSYVARIRQKPVVMLGYNQMLGKGVSYEAFERAAIGPAIQQAIDVGLDTSQQDRWVEHTARLMRHYLYRWAYDSNSLYDRTATHLADQIKNGIQTGKFDDFTQPRFLSNELLKITR